MTIETLFEIEAIVNDERFVNRTPAEQWVMETLLAAYKNVEDPARVPGEVE